MNSVWLAAKVLLSASWLAAEPATASEVTQAEPAPVLVSTEVVRVTRDFGKPHFDLVIDGWTDSDAVRLHEARLWWSNTSEAGRRKPLGRMIERMVQLKYRRISSTALTVKVAGDDKEFTFTVELGKDAQIHAYVAVDTDDGKFIPRCRTTGARLLARRVLGMPVGISRISVTCLDAQGAEHQGQLRHRDL